MKTRGRKQQYVCKPSDFYQHFFQWGFALTVAIRVPFFAIFLSKTETLTFFTAINYETCSRSKPKGRRTKEKGC
jgi:hypothetical protein